LPNDQADRDHSIELDIFLTQAFQPAAQKMQDKKKIDRYPDRVDEELDEKRKERLASIGFHKGARRRIEKIEQRPLAVLRPLVNDENDCAPDEIS